MVGLAKANYAVATLSDVDTPTFDNNGKYNKTNWNDGDIITNASLNKIEDGIYTTNENVTATKKYVDDKVTVKILPVDYDKNCATNVADLEPHSIYMSPNDAKFLYLAYEKLSGSLVGFLFTAKSHGRFIYTGVKDDTKIEIMMEGSCYTVYFKTDTVDAHVEKTVFYLTKNNTTEFTPSNDYEPATKKYVDDNTPIKSLPVNPTTKTAATVDVNNITSSGCYALPKRADGTQWTNLRMRAIVNDGSGNSKVLLLTGYQNFVFHVNIESKKIYCDNLRIVYNIGTTADTTYIDTEPYYLPTTNTKEYTPTNDYNPATKKYVDDKIKTDLGTSELTTTAKDIKGAVNELNTQYKDIANNKADKNEVRLKNTNITLNDCDSDMLSAIQGGQETGNVDVTYELGCYESDGSKNDREGKTRVRCATAITGYDELYIVRNNTNYMIGYFTLDNGKPDGADTGWHDQDVIDITPGKGLLINIKKKDNAGFTDVEVSNMKQAIQIRYKSDLVNKGLLENELIKFTQEKLAVSYTLNKNIFTLGSITNGVATSNNTRIHTDFIKVTKGDVLTFNKDYATFKFGINVYDTNREWNKVDYGWRNTQNTFQIENDGYIRLVLAYGDNRVINNGRRIRELQKDN